MISLSIKNYLEPFVFDVLLVYGQKNEKKKQAAYMRWVSWSFSLHLFDQYDVLGVVAFVIGLFVYVQL